MDCRNHISNSLIKIPQKYYIAYCKEWAKQTGYPLHFIKQAKHFANGDNPEQVNNEIEKFIIETVLKERKNYAVL